MRGQAHIVYRDIQAATQAMRALQGFEFMGMEMQIQYAKTKSDTIAKLDGTFNRPTAKAGEVVASELQQSIFSGPPPSSTSAETAVNGSGAATLKVLPPGIEAGGEGRGSSAGGSVAGQKRRRDEDDEEGSAEEDSEGDAAMEEDSDDD